MSRRKSLARDREHRTHTPKAAERVKLMRDAHRDFITFSADNGVSEFLEKSLSAIEPYPFAENVRDDPAWQAFAAACRERLVVVWERAVDVAIMGDALSFTEAKRMLAHHFLDDGLGFASIVAPDLVDQVLAADRNRMALLFRGIVFRVDELHLWTRENDEGAAIASCCEEAREQLRARPVWLDYAAAREWARSWLEAARAHYALIHYAVLVSHGDFPMRSHWRSWRSNWYRLRFKHLHRLFARFETAIRRLKRQMMPTRWGRRRVDSFAKELRTWRAMVARPWSGFYDFTQALRAEREKAIVEVAERALKKFQTAADAAA